MLPWISTGLFTVRSTTVSEPARTLLLPVSSATLRIFTFWVVGTVGAMPFTFTESMRLDLLYESSQPER